MKFVYFPTYYMFISRYKSLLDKMSWLIQRIIPIFIILTYQLNIDGLNFFLYLVLYLLADMVFTSVYEIGYIYNDVITTTKEKSPTIRLNAIQLDYLESNFILIVTLKFLVACVFLGVLFYFAKEKSILINVEEFVFLLLFTTLVFFAHNIVRNRLNILTFIFLVFFKFTYALILFLPSNLLPDAILVSMLMFPVPRIIENICSKKFGFTNIQRLVGSFDLFRVLYFAVLLICLLVFNVLHPIDLTLLMYVLVYFFFYRLASFLLVKMKLYRR